MILSVTDCVHGSEGVVGKRNPFQQIFYYVQKLALTKFNLKC